MNYDEMITLFYDRLEKGIKPYITEEEAKKYLGEENIRIIEMLIEYCRNQGYKIYVHETDKEAASDIISRGFIGHGESEEITREEFIKKSGMKPGDKLTIAEYDDDIPVAISEGNFAHTEFDDLGELSRSTHLGILDDRQHFFAIGLENFSYANFVYANVNRSSCGAKCIAIIPEDFQMFQSQHTQYGVKHSHINKYTGQEVPQSYFQREVVDKEYFIGYFDIINKEWVINKNFELHHREGIGNRANADNEIFTIWLRQKMNETRNESDDIER